MSSNWFCKLSTFSESMNPVNLKMLKLVPNTGLKPKKGALPTGYPEFDPPFEDLRYFDCKKD
jgi:hypothetical protein